jgi:SAM-dependent methyltransferase
MEAALGPLETAVTELITEEGITSVCDFGCGSGHLLESLRAHVPHDLDLVGVDYFSRMPEVRRPRSDAGFRQVDNDSPEFEALLRGEPGFDLVISTDALHHFRLPIRELRAIHSLMRPGAHLLLADPEYRHDSAEVATRSINTYLCEIHAALRGKFHRHHYSLEEALDLLDAIPLVEVETAWLERAALDPGSRKQGILEMFGKIDDQAGESLDAVSEEFLRRLLELGRELVERHGIQGSRSFMIRARRA